MSLSDRYWHLEAQYQLQGIWISQLEKHRTHPKRSLEDKMEISQNIARREKQREKYLEEQRAIKVLMCIKGEKLNPIWRNS